MPRPRRTGLTRLGVQAGAALVAGPWLLASSPAFGFCRTTTCGSEKAPDCAESSTCPTGGAPLFWPEARVTIGVENGSRLRGISVETAREVLAQSMNSWTSVDCGGRPPSIAVGPITFVPDVGPFWASKPDATSDSDNALRFFDDFWPHETSAIALTTVRYGLETGKIVAADIEANAADHRLTVSDSGGDFDLQSVLTHEAGHFLGLAHVRERPDTMFAMYSGGGNIDRRTLEENDRQGICAAYPSNRFDDDSGCSCSIGRAPAAGRFFLWLPAAAWMLRRSRRTRGQPRATPRA